MLNKCLTTNCDECSSVGNKLMVLEMVCFLMEGDIV